MCDFNNSLPVGGTLLIIYYMKVKEKYDQTSLDIVLKRLVNENFEWCNI